MALKGRSVTILGAGIGGLTAAIALARRGARVTVVEQAPELVEVGAGLQITPNGTAVLAALGLGDRVARIGVSLEAVELREHHAGNLVLRLNMTQAQHGNDNPYLLVHRADLVEMLAQAARRHGVAMILGKRVTGVAIGFDQATLPFEDGSQRNCRILVGADGIHSVTRQAVAGAREPRFTGQVAWRATVEARHVPIHDMPRVATVYMGPRRHLVTYPLREGRMINIVAVEERAKWVAEGWNHLDDPANLRRAFSGFPADIRRLLGLCENVHLWGLFAHPVAERWYRGTTAILGDAAHPTLPFLAQGANMAIEDAWVLAEELDRNDEIEPALVTYQKRRRKRARRIVRAATDNTRIYHMSSPLLRGAAHAAMRVAGQLTPEMMLRRYDWLYGMDVTRTGQG